MIWMMNELYTKRLDFDIMINTMTLKYIVDQGIDHYGT